MTEIDVPDWVVEAGVKAMQTVTHWESHEDFRQKVSQAVITAALVAWVGPELDEYQRMRDGVGGCTDGGCVIKRPTGMHTNGGCKCWQDKIKAQRMMRAGQKLFDTLRQEKPE